MISFVISRIVSLVWVEISLVNRADISDHALQFGGAHIFVKDIRSCLVFGLRGKSVMLEFFCNIELLLEQLLGRIKLHSW